MAYLQLIMPAPLTIMYSIQNVKSYLQYDYAAWIQYIRYIRYIRIFVGRNKRAELDAYH